MRQIICMPSTVVCEQNGVTFPVIYRLTGNIWKQAEGGELTDNGLLTGAHELLESGEESPPLYTLDTTDDKGLLNPRWEAIPHLAQNLDPWCLVLRHHKDSAAMKSYIDALVDTTTWADDDRYSSNRTNFGHFTLLRRKPTPGTPNHLLVYQTKVRDPRYGRMDWTRVIGPTGNEHHVKILYPVDIQEQYSGIKNELDPPED